MFIISITYIVHLDKIEDELQSHIRYLDEQYALGHFLASGPKVPRTGGIILSKIKKRDQLEALLDKDPWKANGYTTYDIVEFIPTKTNKDLVCLLEKQ